MNYGLPYKGSKNRIAKKILDVLPAAPVLYDVFCGGCAITHAALLSGKYSRVVANDINGMIPHAFEKAIRGGFRNEDRWISREEFITSKITLDIFDIADILTAALQERGFLQAGESLTPYDLESAMNRPGYYLTVERKNGTLSVKRG